MMIVVYKETVTFEDSEDVYLRIVGNGEGLATVWYKLNQHAFEWVEDAYDLDDAWMKRYRIHSITKRNTL